MHRLFNCRLLIASAFIASGIFTAFGAVIYSENFDSLYTDNQSVAATAFASATFNSTYGTAAYQYKGTGSLVASTTSAFSGSRSLRVSADTGPTNSSWAKFNFGTAPGTTAPTNSDVNINFAFNIQTLGTGTNVRISNSSGTLLGFITLGSGSAVKFYYRTVAGSIANLDLYTVAQGFSANNWYMLDVNLGDVSGGSSATSYSAKVTDTSGNLLGNQQSGLVYTNLSTNFNYSTLEFLDSDGSGSSFNYFDNIVVQTVGVPEPSFVFGFALSGLLLFLGLKRNIKSIG